MTSIRLATLLVFAFASESAVAESALEMRDNCKAIAMDSVAHAGARVTIPTTPEAFLCWGGFSALQGLIVVVDSSGKRMMNACVPGPVSRKQLVEIFYQYAVSNPDLVHKEWTYVAWMSLMEAFPC